MADLEKKNSQALSNTNDDFLDWNEYDEEYEEDDNSAEESAPAENDKPPVSKEQKEDFKEVKP